jgi:hemolysin activation/secretion protein
MHNLGRAILILLLLDAAVARAQAVAVEPTVIPPVEFHVVPDAGAQNVVVMRSIARALSELGDRPADLQDVQKWSDRLTGALRQRGFPFGQVLMAQGDWDGAQRTDRYVFLVFPGNIGEIQVKNTSRVDDERLKRVISRALCDVDANVLEHGHVCLLQSTRLERTTQLLQDIPGVSIAGAPGFSAGKELGDVQVDFTLEEKGKPFQAGLILDNNGMQATGSTRAGINLSGNNLFHAGDAYGLMLMDTQKQTKTGSANASTPLGYSGLRLASQVTRQQFTTNVVTPILGISTVYRVGLQYPFTRGLDSNVWGGLWLQHNESESTLTDFGVGTRSTIDSVQWSLQADNGDRALQLRTDRWSAQAALTVGHNNNNDLGNVVTRRAGDYVKLSGWAFGSHGLDKSGDIFVTGRIVGQLANRNLDGSEQLGLGGPGAVRAYRADEGSADEGAVVNLGLYWRVPITTGHQLQFGGIVDAAYGRVNHAPWNGWAASYVGIPDVSNNRNLYGYGASLDWLTPWGVMLSFTVARPFGFSSVSWVEPDKGRPHQYWLSAVWSY